MCVFLLLLNMLKAKFEGGEDMDDMDDMDDMGDEEEAEEVEEYGAPMEEAKDEDQVEENTNTDVHTQLQERFQKLANIIK